MTTPPLEPGLTAGLVLTGECEVIPGAPGDGPQDAPADAEPEDGQ